MFSRNEVSALRFPDNLEENSTGTDQQIIKKTVCTPSKEAVSFR